MGASELSALLWRERECLELLVFKLEVQQLLLASGTTRWVGHSAREIEHVLSSLREAGLARTLESEALAVEWGLQESATLREFAELPEAEPWSGLFAAHLAALAELSSEVAALRDVSEQLLRTSARVTQETIAQAWPNADDVTTRGRTGATGDSAARFLDESI